MSICAGCRRPLSGSYITAISRPWHRDCFRCAGCGKAIGQNKYYTRDEQPYHSDCYHQRFSPRCAQCGQVITGKYTTALGKTWHEVHFACAKCGLPFLGVSYYERDGRPYCKRDYHELFTQRCAICNRPMTGMRITNHWGDTYCADHREVYSKCYACHRLICEALTGGGVVYADGRHMCKRCRRTAIDKIDRGAQQTIARVRQTLARLGIDPPQKEIPFQVASQSDLDTSGSKHYFTNHLAGITYNSWTTQNGKVTGRQTEKIRILYGLPTEMFATVAAHELCHSYFFLSEFPKVPPFVEEGLCELAASLWLAEQNTPEAAYRLTSMDSEHNDNPIYGDGYRFARRALERYSLQSLLSYVRKHGHFPE